MKEEMLNLADWVTKTARASGADDSRVTINSERFIEISYRERKPENIREASTRGLNLEIYVTGRYSSQSTSDLRKESLKKFITNALTTTKLLAEDPYRSLPDPKYYEGREKFNLELTDPEYLNFSVENRHNLVKTIEEACLSRGGERVISVSAMTYDTHLSLVQMTSNGFEGSSDSTVYYAGASLTARDEGNRRPSGSESAMSVKRKDLPHPELIGQEAARRALEMLGAKKIKTEKMPVIIENRIVPRILSGFISAMFGRNIQQRQSFLAEKKGQKVTSESLTLIDDPFLKSGLSSRLFDSDGLPAKKRVLIEEGILKEFYIDWYYSRKLNCEPTTGSPSNLIIHEGKRSLEEIMKDIGRGILITGFIGGNSNSTTGDMSIGIFGKLFENGEFVQPVAEMNIADNHLIFWKKLVEIANDTWIYSDWRTPSLVFQDVIVSGE